MPGGKSVSPRADAVWSFVIALSLIVGAWLRWYQLRTQVLLDDEWHAVHQVLHSDAAGIATTFGFADHSIPLTLYYRFLALHGGLTEWVMRLPMLLSGIALIVVAPWLLRRNTTLSVRAMWAALLAVSPLLVYQSRTARPYALTSLLTLVAIVAFYRWWREEKTARGWAVGYVAATVLAGWLHPITLPFTLLPFVYVGVRALLAPERAVAGTYGTVFRRLILLGFATAIPLAAALLPPLILDWGRFWARAGVHSITPDSVYRTLLMLFGIAQPALLVVMTMLTGLGSYRLWQLDRDWATYLAAVMLGAAVVIGAAGPQWIHHPPVLARYLQPALPFLLLLLAEGAVACLEALRRRALQASIGIALVALLCWAGPMPDYLYPPNQFIGHLRFQYDYDPAHNPYVQEVPRDPIPAFYRELAGKPPRTLTLIEAPWRLESNFNPQPWYQQIHRQYIKIGLVTPVCGVREFGEYPATVTALRFNEFVHLSVMLAGNTYGADFLVMHLKPWKTPPDAEVEWPDVAACLPAIEAKFGKPVFRDDQIVVFGLKGG